MRADDIPVAFTPPGGWSDEWPAPVLAGCTEPVVDGAPDMAGVWRVAAVEVEGTPVDDHRALGAVQRIEQCGDRVVVTASGIIHDMRCDGTEERGVHDVAEMDKVTPITVVASYEDGVHVLRPVGLPVEVRRWRDGDQLVWQYLGFTARLDRVGPPDVVPGDVDAGDFSAWLGSVLGAIRDGDESAVPCGGCTACCTSSQFVHIEPDEADALAHIPAALLFPAPGRPRGHVLLGFDERGHCPMLIEGACSIYEHRPRTCRAYDCRVFAATGLEPGGAQVAIATRARRWRFRERGEDERAERTAVETAARCLAEHRAHLGSARVPADPTQLAVLAVDIHDVFLHRDEAGRLRVVDPGIEALADAVDRAGGRF